MRDFPLFTTDTGLSCLTLKEIPYRQTAYIRIMQLQETGFRPHLRECLDFCKMAGAEQVFATGSSYLEEYPIHCEIFKMQGRISQEGATLAQLFPVTKATVSQWRDIYNSKMQNVDHATYLEQREETAIAQGQSYFVHEAEKLLGIGYLSGNKLLAMAAVAPGAGARVMHTLASVVPDGEIHLEVASTNHRALHLYKKLGLVQTECLYKWYQAFP